MGKTPECHPDRPYRANGMCFKCYALSWERENRDVVARYARISQRANRAKAIQNMGAACRMCGMTDIRILEIDHVAGQRGRKREHNTTTYRRAANGYFADLQLLCPNCHAIKTYYPDRTDD